MSTSSRWTRIANLRQHPLVQRCQTWMQVHPRIALAVPSGLVLLLLVFSLSRRGTDSLAEDEPEDLSVFASQVQQVSPNGPQSARSGVSFPDKRSSADKKNASSFAEAVQQSLNQSETDLPSGFPVRPVRQDPAVSRTSYQPDRPNILQSPPQTRKPPVAWLTGQIQEIPPRAPAPVSTQRRSSASPTLR